MQTLADRCNVAGAQLGKLGNFVRRQLNRQLEEPLTDAEWQQHGRVAAFLAFVQLGGLVEDHHEFDWSSAEFMRRGLSVLQQLTLGSQSDVYDQVLRSRHRLGGCQVEELSWDSWNSASSADLAGHRGFEEAATGDGLHLQEPRERPEIGDTLIVALTKVLRPQEVVWLIRRYRDGISTSVLASELVSKTPKYQTADGYARAVRCIDVAVHRAKHKARTLLSGEWRALAQEVVV